MGNKAWESLPKEYKAVLDTACAEAYTWMVSKYDALNPPALKRLIGNGVELKPFSDQIMAAFYKTSKEVYDEIAAKNPKFKKIYDPWNKFREDQVQWFSIAEGREDNFMATVERMAQRSAPKKR